jgi:hypothetical protein
MSRRWKEMEWDWHGTVWKPRLLKLPTSMQLNFIRPKSSGADPSKCAESRPSICHCRPLSIVELALRISLYSRRERMISCCSYLRRRQRSLTTQVPIAKLLSKRSTERHLSPFVSMVHVFTTFRVPLTLTSSPASHR